MARGALNRFTARAPGLALFLAAFVPSVTSAVDGDGFRYEIGVDGPLGALAVTCVEPCDVDETRNVGGAGGDVVLERSRDPLARTGSSARRDPDRSYAEDGITCIGACEGQGGDTTITIGAVRSLIEGVTVRITDGWARFIFHSVIDTESGPTTRRQVSEFRIDRPLIELTLHGHAVVVRRHGESAP